MKIGKKKVKIPSYQLKKPHNALSTNINVILGPNFLLLITSLNAT
jgi:hypothetical protein